MFKRKDGRLINWLEDRDMLPAAMPDANRNAEEKCAHHGPFDSHGSDQWLPRLKDC